jgi:hypothetical protein
VNDEMERMGKEAITIYFKTLSRREKTEENYAKTQVTTAGFLAKI